MPEEKQSSESGLSAAIHAERHAPKRAIVSDTLMKSPQWKMNTLHKIEVERLRTTVAELESENARVAKELQSELEELRAELIDSQQAYDQFEQQSDKIIGELDEQNERLRVACKTQNRQSLL